MLAIDLRTFADEDVARNRVDLEESLATRCLTLNVDELVLTLEELIATQGIWARHLTMGRKGLTPEYYVDEGCSHGKVLNDGTS